ALSAVISLLTSIVPPRIGSRKVLVRMVLPSTRSSALRPILSVLSLPRACFDAVVTVIERIGCPDLLSCPTLALLTSSVTGSATAAVIKKREAAIVNRAVAVMRAIEDPSALKLTPPAFGSARLAHEV